MVPGGVVGHARGMSDMADREEGGVANVTGVSADDVAWLARAEHDLWDEQARFDQARIDALWASGFYEIGRSGRRRSRIELLQADHRSIGAVLQDLEVHPVTDDVVLVRYVSTEWPQGEGVGDGRPAHRTSVWRRERSLGWELVFHQATPAST